MSKTYLPLLILCIFSTTFAQTPVNKISEALETRMSNVSAGDEILVWVYFSDKGNDTDLYFRNPQLVVSGKSIKRREKVSDKSSPITIRDLPVNKTYINQIKLKGLILKHQSKWLNAVSGTINKAQISEITSLPFVRKLDIVYKLKKGTLPVPDQNKIMQLMNKVQEPPGIHSYDYGDSYSEMQQINVPAVHDLGFTGQGVTICLMDAGFSRLSHTVFSSMNIIAAWDFVNNDPNVGNQSDSGDGSHGTETLSTIGGYAPGHLIGPAFNSSYILAKTENTDSETPLEEDNWIAAMEWADSIGVDVTSTSLGYIDFDPPWQSYTWMDMDGNTTVITNGADYAAYIGIVVVNSAGNEGYNASHNTLGAPSDGDSVIAAGAVDYSGSRVSFSSVGPTVDGRFKPDIMALGSGNIVAYPYDDYSYTYASGTSFSCPLSAGVAALILCANPQLTPMQVRDAMRNTASQNSTPDNSYGWGILNALDAVNYFPPPPTTFQLTVFIHNGWNMVSVPGINPDGQGINNWWLGHIGNVYTYENGIGYYAVTGTSPTRGYWMKNGGDQVYNTGDEWPAGGIQIVPHEPINAPGSWQLIGVYECPAAAINITTVPPGCLSLPIYGFTPSSGYTEEDTLYPGYAYWVKILCPCQIIIPDCNSKQTAVNVPQIIKNDLPEGRAGWGRIIFTDNTGKSYTLYSVKGETDLNLYELPPQPPAGIFDIRFSSGRIAEELNKDFKSIEMNGINYPVKVKLENTEIRLMDMTGKEINVNLKSGEEITISNANINKLMVSEQFIPDKYSLEQNYPNPFNATTTLRFSFPKEVRVNLSLYNILGEKIKELKNEVMKPGFYDIEFDASTIASGVYFYRIKAGDFVQTKKMILLK